MHSIQRVIICISAAIDKVYLAIYVYRKAYLEQWNGKCRVFACLNMWPQGFVFILNSRGYRYFQKNFRVQTNWHRHSRGVKPKVSRKLAEGLRDGVQIESIRVKKCLCYWETWKFNFKLSHILLLCIKCSYKCSRIRYQTSWTGIKSLIRDFFFIFFFFFNE